ncbi:MAG: glutamyl-tRNA reductase [Ktedonobacterales bacterium]
MIGLIGLDHHQGNAELRGRVSFAGERLLDALRSLGEAHDIDEVAIISTCNRTEVYAATEDWPSAATAIRGFLRDTCLRSGSTLSPRSLSKAGQPSADATGSATGSAPAGTMLDVPTRPTAVTSRKIEELERSLYEYEGLQAARHLFRVAAGLQSMVVGEAQILGQVKDALTAAESVHVVGEELRSTFTTAIKVGKRARAETEIGRADVSVAALAVRVARESLGGLGGRSALLIGAGRTSQMCAQLLRSEGIGRLFLANRTAQTAADLAAEVDGDAIALADIETAIPSVELIISATAAPHMVLNTSTVARGVTGRRTPLVIVDLAVPPDVDEAVGLLPNVSLYTLDSLRSLDGGTAIDAVPQRDDELAHISEIIEDGVYEVQRSRVLRRAVPGIAALRRHVDESEQAELTRTLGRLQHLSEADRALIERFGERLVDKMFHHLVSRIRSLAEYDEVPPDVTMKVLGRLFADPKGDGEAQH